MATKRHKPEGIVSKLRQVDVPVGQGFAYIWWRDIHSVVAVLASNVIGGLQASAECRLCGL